MRSSRGFVFLGAIAALLFVAFGGIPAQQPPSGDEAGRYIADPRMCVCGLRDPRQLTHPARVDYPRLYEATPQVTEMRREGIDPDSARGVILHTEAEALLRRLCTEVRKRYRHCSIWKEIRRRDGGAIPDRTAAVLERMPGKIEAPVGSPG